MTDHDPTAEVRAAHDRYERALTGNDIPVLDELFLDSPHTVRIGAGEELFGADAIARFRRARPTNALDRTPFRTEVTCYGDDTAVTTTLYTRPGTPGTGRQTQTWHRFPEGWRIVAAHVSHRP